MFGSCESIFGTEVPRKTVKSVSSTELQMMEMEISTDLAQAEVDNAKISSTTMQLDQLLNMYDHVKQYGIDRTFLSLYNRSNQLNNMLGVKFPSCESVDSEGYPNSNMSKTLLVAMEDEKEGIFAKIGQGIKWIWEKIKHICSVGWNKLKSWLGLSSKKNKETFENAAEQIKKAPKEGIFKKTIKFASRHKILTTVTAITAICTFMTHRTCGLRNIIRDSCNSERWELSSNAGHKLKDDERADFVKVKLKNITELDRSNKENYTKSLNDEKKLNIELNELLNKDKDKFMEVIRLGDLTAVMKLISEGKSFQDILDKAKNKLDEGMKETEKVVNDAKINKDIPPEVAKDIIKEGNDVLKAANAGMKELNNAQSAINDSAASIQQQVDEQMRLHQEASDTASRQFQEAHDIASQQSQQHVNDTVQQFQQQQFDSMPPPPMFKYNIG